MKPTRGDFCLNFAHEMKMTRKLFIAAFSIIARKHFEVYSFYLIILVLIHGQLE